MQQGSYKRLEQGFQRTLSPEQTLDKIVPLMQSMGITRIANITGLDIIGIPVVTVCRPNSKAIAVAQGKGLTIEAAKASGLMEAIETFHGEYIDLPLKLANLRELKTNNTVADVERLPQLGLNRFHQDLDILWVQGNDYQSQTPVYVPYEMVHCNYTLPFPTGSGAFMMSTNGLASGNTLAEAISHGLCEVIERDATTVWKIQKNHREQSARKLNLSTIDDPEALQLLERFTLSEISVHVWDITSNIGIPTFYCTIINQHQAVFGPLSPSKGIGTHPDKGVALVRALTEAAQSRLTLISGSRDDVTENHYTEGQNLQLFAQQTQKLNQIESQKDYQQIPTWQYPKVEQDIDQIIKQLNAQNIHQVVVVNLSKTEFEIPVVRIIVPGLEGIEHIEGFKPGKRAIEQLKSQPFKSQQ